MLIKRSLSVENLFLLSIQRMTLHSKHFKDELESKLKKKE